MKPNTWTRTSKCANGSCVETYWKKSTHSGGNGCVETRHTDTVQVRDSKLDNSPILQFHPTQWAEFIHAIKTGQVTR